MGSFLLDLNEITNARNSQLRAESDDNFYSQSGYFTMTKDGEVTADRLGMKVMLVREENEETEQNLVALLHYLGSTGLKQIQSEFDKNLKGTVEAEEL